jgi:hypothetical protein
MQDKRIEVVERGPDAQKERSFVVTSVHLSPEETCGA